MQPEVRDLLREAKADPPLARYDVDDVVWAGKRRQRRRATGWASGAVLAVAVAVAVPFAVSRPAVEAPEPAAVLPSARSATIDLTFRGYTAGDFRVSDPSRWTLAGLSADIRGTGGSDGALTVYHRGVAAPPSDHHQPAGKIGGRDAYYAEEQGAPMLVWQYADDAFAVVSPRAAGPGSYAMSKPDLLRVARAFRLGDARPVTVPFRVGEVPAGYKLVEADQGSGVRLVPAAVATPRLSDTDHGVPPTRPEQRSQLRIELIIPQAGDLAGTPSTVTTCPDLPAKEGGKGFSGRCYRWLPDGKHALMASGRGKLTRSDLTAVLASTRAEPYPVNQAIPATAQVIAE